MDRNSDEAEITLTRRGQYAEKYTQDGLREAIERIRNNEISYGAASKIYNVPKSTLHHKMKHPENCPKGATTVLTKEQEDELAEWVLLHADFGDPRTKQDIMIAAAEIAQLDADLSSKFKNGIPTSGWMDGFLKRHPLCRERTPQSISKASAVNSRDDFAGLWRNIYNYFEKTNQLDLLNKPELWWNADETYFEKDKIPKKVIARRGMKRVSRREMGPPKANTTVTYAFSAAAVGANYGINQTESGWTKTESFYYYVSMHLHNQWEEKNCPKPRILTIDGYGAHLSPKLFRWCRRNSVIMIVLYPGATPYMQMCDTTMFSPMKEKHGQLYSQWRLKNPTKTMNDVEFVKILKQINDAVIKKESIINGWRATGLQPFNFNSLNTDGLLNKSADRNYDFKGYCIDPPSKSTENSTINQPKVNVLSDIVLNPSSEQYMIYDESSTTNYPGTTTFIGCHGENNNNYIHRDSVAHNVDLSTAIEQRINMHPASELAAVTMDSVNKDPVFELVDVSMEDIPEGPLDSLEENSFYPQERSNQKNDQNTSTNDQVPIENYVAIAELTGPNEFLKSQSETRFDLSAFGISTEASIIGNVSKMGKLVDKIRHDVKQLGLLCAASDKEKLINILIINQQLNILDPPPVEQIKPPEESRTIKSILKAPTMPQRVHKKRNMNLKVSYGVVTAKEVVQSIMEREAADQQHEIEREEDEISKLVRENEIAELDDSLKHMRKTSIATRSEVAALNKEIIQKKKNKSISTSDLKLKEAAKVEKESLLKEYDEQLRELREKLKNLKAINVETNKAVSLKRKSFELQKKEIGNKVQPSTTQPEIDAMKLDAEPY